MAMIFGPCGPASITTPDTICALVLAILFEAGFGSRKGRESNMFKVQDGSGSRTWEYPLTRDMAAVRRGGLGEKTLNLNPKPKTLNPNLKP